MSLLGQIQALTLKLQGAPAAPDPLAPAPLPGVTTADQIALARKKLQDQDPTKKYTNIFDHSTNSNVRVELKEEGKEKAPPVHLTPGLASQAVTDGFSAGLQKGLLYPISALVPRLFRRAEAQAQASADTIAQFNREEQLANPFAEAVVANAPSLAGDVLGSLVPGIPTYALARRAMQVEKAVEAGKFMEYGLKVTGAGIAQGAMQSALADLDSGESRFQRVARDTMMAGTFEILGLPLLRKAWTAELGEKLAKNVTEAVAGVKGTDITTAEQFMDKLRQGAANDPIAAELVAKAAPDTPVAAQAQKVVESWKASILSRNAPSANPSVAIQDPNYGISFNIYNGDQLIGPMHIQSHKGDVGPNTRFERETVAFAEQMEQAWGQGAKLRFDDFQFQGVGTWTRFTRLLGGGESARPKPPVGPDITTHGFSGEVPSTGAIITTVDGRQGRVTGVRSGIQGPLEAPPDKGGSGGKVSFEDELLQRRGELTRLPEPRTPQGILKDVAPKRDAAGKPQPGTGVWVTMTTADGREVEVPLNSIKAQKMVMAEGIRKPVATKIRPHPDGTPRRGVIDITQGEIRVEDAGSPAPWFRSKEGYEGIDEGYDRLLVRFEASNDGMSLSIPVLGEKERIRPDYGHKLDVGVQDTLESRQHTPSSQKLWEPSGEPKRGDKALVPRIVKRPGYGIDAKVNAGEEVVIRRGDANRIYRTGDRDASGQYTRGGVDREFATREQGEIKQSRPWAGPMRERDPKAPYREEPGFDVYSGTAIKSRTDMDVDVDAQRKFPESRKTNPSVPMKQRTQFEATPPNSVLTPEMRATPELITARNTARLLLRKGIDPETPVRMQLARQTHNWNVWRERPGGRNLREPFNPSYELSLRQLAEAEPVMPDMQHVQWIAQQRGLRVIPDGMGATVMDPSGNYKKEFSTLMEAYEAIGRTPASDGKFSPKIEAGLEKAWNMGFDKSFDAEIDANKFRDVNLLMSNVHEVMGAKRPAATMYSRHETNFTNVVRGIEDYYESKGMPKRNIHVVNLDNMETNRDAMMKKATTRSETRMKMVVYDEAAVKANFAKYAQLYQHMGIDLNAPTQVAVRQLAQFPHGLDMLSGRDPVNAFIYTNLRVRGVKETWEKSVKIDEDSLGRFRVYDPETRKALFQAEMQLPARSPATVAKPCGV